MRPDFVRWHRIKGAAFPDGRGLGVTRGSEVGSWENTGLAGGCGQLGRQEFKNLTLFTHEGSDG